MQPVCKLSQSCSQRCGSFNSIANQKESLSNELWWHQIRRDRLLIIYLTSLWKLAAICNDKKISSKLCSLQLFKLNIFFLLYLTNHQFGFFFVQFITCLAFFLQDYTDHKFYCIFLLVFYVWQCVVFMIFKFFVMFFCLFFTNLYKLLL